MAFESNGDYYVVGQTTDRTAGGGTDYAYIAKHLADGQIAWQQELPNPWGRVSFATSIDIGPNGNLYVCGQMNGCDYLINEGFITCMNNSGGTIWRNDYISQSFDTTYHFSALKVLGNGAIAVGFDNYLMVLDAGGNTVAFNYEPYGRVTEIALGAPGYIVAAGWNGIANFQYIPPYASSFHPTQRWVNDIAYLQGNSTSQDQVLYLSNDRLYKMDFQFNLQDSLVWNLPPASYARQLAQTDSSVWTVVGDSVFHVDGSLQITDKFERPTDGIFYPQELGLQPDQLTQIPSYLVLAGNHGQGTFVQSMDLNGNHNSTGSDLQLVSTRTANEVAVNGFSYDAWATIANVGADTVNYCRLFAYLQTWDICGRNWIFPEFNGLALAPGDSVELSLGMIYDANNTQMPPQTYSLNLCVLAPNKSLDHVSGNNCRPLTMDAFYVGIDDEMAHVEFEAVPNPVRDQLNIQLKGYAAYNPGGLSSNPSFPDLSHKDIQLFDLQGKLLHSQTFSGPVSTLDMAPYSPGIYLVRIGNWVEKIIRQ